MSQPLPLLEWLEQARATPSAATSAALLQKIKDMADAAGCTTETVSISGTLAQVGIKFPGAAVADLRVVFFAYSTTQSPTMLTPDTETANTLMVGISKGVTVETMSSAASGGNPYGSTTFSGFWKCSTTTTSVTHLWMLFSDEALACFTDTNSGASVSHAIAGAFIDPHSEHSSDCETSGRVYGLAAGAQALGAAMWASASVGFLYHSVTATQIHCGCFQPGSSTWKPLRRTFAGTLVSGTPGTTSFRAFSTRSVGLQIWLETTDSPPVVAGRAREIFSWRDHTYNTTIITTGGDTAGYIAAGTVGAASDAALFAARDNRSPN